MNLLNRTKVYLVGAMQYSQTIKGGFQYWRDGRNWRVEAIKELDKMGIISFDPYNNPFLAEEEETEESHDNLKLQIANGNYEEVTETMKAIRSRDLALVDKSDFIIAYVNLSVPTVGTWEEIFWANRLKKPIFFIMEGGVKNLPLWMFGTIPHKYVYSSFEEVLIVLKDIDSGAKDIDSKRWRLLKPEFR